jgi:hypothetical protein
MVTCFHRKRLILRLLEDFHQALATGQAAAGWLASRSLPNAAKASSSRNWAMSRRRVPATCLHGFDLGGAADAGNGQTNVDGRANTGEKQGWFQINLAVGNGNNVGGNVGGNVAGLGFDDGQGGQGTGPELIAQTLAERSSRRLWL